MNRRHSSIAIFVIACLVTGMVVAFADVRAIDGFEGLWHRSQMYNSNMNESYSVLFYSVNFTFLYREEVPLDVPIRVHFKITFLDGSFELLNTSIGGMVLVPPRVVSSSHTNPAAAIVASIDSEHWYQWYYGVSV